MNAIEVLRDHLNIELLKLMEPIQEITTISQSEQIVAPPSIVDGYYDLNDVINLEWIATSQSCWSTYSRSDEACKACSLSSACESARAQAKEAKEESKGLANEIKTLFDAKAKREVLKLAQELIVPQEIQLKDNILCKITGTFLSIGETHLFYKEFGIVHILAKHINN